ncbi:hypothetical protein N9L47_12325 [Rhodobacteraceae bacterium]|nr:hypothetical protein [Paracoccaceae bacterium]
MKHCTAKAGLKFLVAVDNTIFAEDLREFLSMIPDARVDVRRSLVEDCGKDYAVAFLGGSIEQLLQSRQIRQMHKAGTRIVVLNTQVPEASFEGTGILVLSQPFRSEDIAETLAKAGIKVAVNC